MMEETNTEEKNTEGIRKEEKASETDGRDREIQEKSVQEQPMERETYEKAEDAVNEKKSIFRKWTEDQERSRDRLILERIPDDQLMEYLRLEQKRMEMVQKAKEIRSGRFLSAFQLAVSLLSVVAVTGLLKENPTILVNILYIIGIIAALWIWKNPKQK